MHFGQVKLADIDTAGLRYVRACASRAAVPLTVSVQSIPADMRYLNSSQTAAIPYAIYGAPSQDLGTVPDRARGVKYTMLTWSWVNTRGGGVARALVPEGTQFYRCSDVPAITLSSVADAESKRPTGWVEARYGAIHAGDDAWLHGWIVSRHRHAAEGDVVPHLR